MKPIIVVRHAHPVDGQIPVRGNWVDAELSDRGCQQAQRVAERLRRDLAGESCRIWSSDLCRATKTAGAIGQALGVPVQTTGDLREHKDGLADDVLESELRKYVPRESRPMADLLANRQAETWPEFYGRVAQRMDQLLARDDDRLLIVVGHYGTNSNIVNWWLNLGLTTSGDTPVTFETGLASITVLGCKTSGKRSIERLNDIAHLYAEDLASPLLSRLAPTRAN